MWKSVAQTGETIFLVLQVGDTLSFYAVDEDGVVSNSKKSFTVDITTFKIASSPAVTTEACSFAAGNGLLYVAHPFCDPFSITYNATTDTISTARLTLVIRDIDGIENKSALGVVIDVDHRPDYATEVSANIEYNLRNQGWSASSACTLDNKYTVFAPVLDYWNSQNTVWPSEADIWWTMKAPVIPSLDSNGNIITGVVKEAFSKLEFNTFVSSNSPAPKGHYLWPAFDVRRSSVLTYKDGATLTEGSDLNPGYFRPSQIAFFAGRVWYSGVNTFFYNNFIFFSQLNKPERCYQQQDPTKEEGSDLLPTDGGTIRIPDAARILKLFALGSALYVFASNGVWRVSGSEGSGFSANNYNITKISPTEALGPQSFVDVEGAPIWWNSNGIYTIKQEAAGAIGQVVPLTHTTIKTFYEDIPIKSKLYCKSAYNPFTKVVQFLFTSTSPETVTDRYKYDRILNLDTLTGAFYPWTLPKDECLYVAGIICLQGQTLVVSSENVTDSGVVVTDSAVAVTVGNVVTQTELESVFKYITVADCFTEGGDTTSSYNSNFLGHLEVATFGNGPATPQNGVIIGEDGEYYTVAATNAGNIFYPQKWDGTGSYLNYTAAQIRSDVELELGHTFANFTNIVQQRYCIPVPYTQYFYFYLSADDGAFPFGWAVFALYKIDSGGNIVFQAAKGYYGSIYSTPALNLQTIHAVDFKGEPLANPLNQTLLILLGAAGSITFVGTGATVIELPSVNDFIADSGNYSEIWSDLWNLNASFGDGYSLSGSNSNGYARAVNAAFFLPVNIDGVWDNYICVYAPKGVCDWQISNTGVTGSSTLLYSFALLYPNGFVIAKSLDATDDWTVINSHFKAEDGSDLIPFADLGLNKDNTVGDSSYNDWDTPSVQHDVSSGLSYLTWGRHYKDITVNMGTEGSYVKALLQSWNPTTQTASWLSEVEGAPWDAVVDMGLTVNPSYPYTPELFLFLSPDRTQMYVYTRDDGGFNSGSFGNAHYSLSLFADVDIQVSPSVSGITISQFTNTDTWLDWVLATGGVDFDSYFVSGYKLRGDAIKKWQTNYLRLYTRNDDPSMFDFKCRWDFSKSGDTGRWNQTQRISMDNTDYAFRTKRLKVRGNGLALQFQVNSVSQQPFDIVGWSGWDSSNSNP